MSLPDNPDPTNPDRTGDPRPSASLSSSRQGLEPIRVFEEASSMSVQVEILKEQLDEIVRVIEANEWEMGEGLTTILLSGLGLQKGRVHLDEVNGMVARGEAHADQRVDAIVQE